MTGTSSSGWRKDSWRLGRHVLVAVTVGILTLGALSQIERPLRDKALTRLHLEVYTAASVPRARLEQELVATLALSHGMASLFVIDGLPDGRRFAQLAAQAMRASPHIRNIGLSEGTVIRHVWPAQGNAAALGIDYRTVPEQWPLVERAMTTRRPVLAGPVPLVQGGTALIQRIPLFAQGSDPEGAGGDPGRFLGLLGLVINVDSLLDSAGLASPPSGLRLALRGGDGAGGGGAMIWGDPNLFTADPELLDISLPGGAWQLAAVPAGGWRVDSPLFDLLRGLELAASLLVGAGAFGLLRRRAERQRDIDQIRASEARLRNAQRIGGMGAFEWNITTGEAWWSDELYMLFQWEPSAAVPLDRLYAAILPDDSKALRGALTAARHPGGRLDQEFRMIRADGIKRTLRCWGEVAESKGGEPDLRLQGLVLDVTERAKADRERERLVGRLRRSNEELERFATIAAHDLQEPLRQIASPLQLLQRRYAGHLDADTETFIGDAVDGAKRMQRQILDLLEFSRLGTTPSERRPVDTAAALAEARAVLFDEETAANASVSVGPLPMVSGDHAHIVLLFTHLLHNALRFRKPDTPAQITVEARQDGDDWHFTITDAGIGVAPAYHEQIFDVFRRLCPPDGNASGIGLALCRRIVEHHDGRIWIESQEGQGATFHILLPALGALAPQNGAAATASA